MLSLVVVWWWVGEVHLGGGGGGGGLQHPRAAHTQKSPQVQEQHQIKCKFKNASYKLNITRFKHVTYKFKIQNIKFGKLDETPL